MLSGLESELNGDNGGDRRSPDLFSDAPATLTTLAESGSINLIEYSELPSDAASVLPPFTHIVRGPATPADIEPSLHTVESRLNWLDTIAAIDALHNGTDQVVLVSNTVAGFDLAAERGWLTVWLNRDRVANLADITPSAEIHTLLDLPEALETIEEAVAAAEKRATLA